MEHIQIIPDTRGLPWGPLIAEQFIETVLGAAVAIVMIMVGTRLLPKTRRA